MPRDISHIWHTSCCDLCSTTRQTEVEAASTCRQCRRLSRIDDMSGLEPLTTDIAVTNTEDAENQNDIRV